MRILSIGDEPGLFAFGQFATGVIAIGQVATGVVAIGQVARGVVAVGQLGIGLFAAGQVCVGLFGAAGIGVGGRGKGLVLPLVPTIEPPYDFPPCTTFDNVKAGFGDGWIEAKLQQIDGGHIGLGAETGLLPLKLACQLVMKARSELMRFGDAPVVAHIRRMGDVLVCDRLMHVPTAMTTRPGFWIGLALRMLFVNDQMQMQPTPNQEASSQIVGVNWRTVKPSALSSDGTLPGRMFQ
jgi:hypothetical protein